MADIEEGIRQLDAGQGREIDFDQLLRELNSKELREDQAPMDEE
jgi:hypothetical protein